MSMECNHVQMPTFDKPTDRRLKNLLGQLQLMASEIQKNQDLERRMDMLRQNMPEVTQEAPQNS